MSRCSRLPEQRRRLQDYLLLTRQQRLLTTSKCRRCPHLTSVNSTSALLRQPWSALSPTRQLAHVHDPDTRSVCYCGTDSAQQAGRRSTYATLNHGVLVSYLQFIQALPRYVFPKRRCLRHCGTTRVAWASWRRRSASAQPCHIITGSSCPVSVV